eukprot:scaffold172350_cov20-Prasinocladus_malaysianus.AAC.1
MKSRMNQTMRGLLSLGHEEFHLCLAFRWMTRKPRRPRPRRRPSRQQLASLQPGRWRRRPGRWRRRCTRPGSRLSSCRWLRAGATWAPSR